jgi:glutathione S-transferase
MKLIIGDKRWSTWSMRPWLALHRAGAAFEEIKVALRQDAATTQAILAAGSPSGLAPVLIDGDLTIHDSLAICEYLAERFPAARLWPDDMAARALARAAAAEMHAGFMPVRRDLSMDVGARHAVEIVEETAAAIRRIVTLWRGMIDRFGGPFLGGADWGNADAFFTPVATRFVTYGIDLAAYGDGDDGAAAAYRDLLLVQPEYLAWERGALAEA